MSDMIPFEFNSHAVRVFEIDGEPWFVGKDVAEALGYADATTAIRSHCKGVQKLHPLQTAGGSQQVRILSEPDVLRLMISSTLPAAQEFEALVFEVILPTIRKTGSYSVAPDTGAIPLAKERELTKELINLQHRLLKAERELDEYHRQQRICTTIERMIKAGLNDEQIAQSMDTTSAYAAHCRIRLEDYQSQQAPA